MKSEEWRTISLYFGKYLVSNFGDVKSLHCNDGQREMERKTGFLREAVSRHCRGNKNYTHAYGFLWEFKTQ